MGGSVDTVMILMYSQFGSASHNSCFVHSLAEDHPNCLKDARVVRTGISSYFIVSMMLDDDNTCYVGGTESEVEIIIRWLGKKDHRNEVDIYLPLNHSSIRPSIFQPQARSREKCCSSVNPSDHPWLCKLVAKPVKEWRSESSLD